VPRPLALLLVAVAVLGVAWAMFTPSWQAPDEPAHYGYVESLAQRHSVPGARTGFVYSSEQSRALQRSNGDKLSQLSDGRPQWFDGAEGVFGEGELPTDNGGGNTEGDVNPARSNPPAYYLYETVAYGAAGIAGTTPARLYWMRIASVLLLLVTVTGAWLLVGELFGRRRDLQLVAAGLTGLLPMATFISGSVTPDALLCASWSLVLWLGVKSLRSALTRRGAVALCAVTALAVLTKATSYALVPPVAAVVLFGLIRHRRSSAAGGELRIAALSFSALVVPVLAWVVAARAAGRPSVNQVGSTGTENALADQAFNAAQIASYMWQFYLPRLSSQADFPQVVGVPVYDVWLKDLTGRFGWVQIALPDGLYVAAGVTAVVIIVVGIVQAARQPPPIRLGFAFLGLVALLTVIGLHVVDYRIAVQQSLPFMQGRYLLPLVPIGGALLAATLSGLGPRLRSGMLALFLGGLAAFQVVAFAQAAGYWYV